MSRPLIRLVEGDPALAGGPGAIPISGVPDEPFGLTGTTVAAVVDDAVTSSAVLQALVRGADVVLRLDLPDAAGLLDALARIGDVCAPSAAALDREQWALLDLLARGNTAGEAARQIGMSLRTAHRRLGAARAALGAACNAEAIARLSTMRPADS